MAYYSLNPAPATATTILAARSRTSTHLTTISYIQRVHACHQTSDLVGGHDRNIVQRRNLSLGLAGVVLCWSVVGDRNANAAARRPPPSPTEEKRDPNVSSVQAKVLASKRRKEAMKEAVSKMRERGKAIKEPSQ